MVSALNFCMHGENCAGIFGKQLFSYYGKCINLTTERFISSLPHCRAAAVFPIPSSTCHQCRESRLRSLHLLASPPWGTGCIRFLGSAIATARWTSSSLYAWCSPIFIDDLLLLPPRRQPQCKDVYLLLVVCSRILSVASTRYRDFVSDHSASLDSYICDICC